VTEILSHVLGNRDYLSKPQNIKTTFRLHVRLRFMSKLNIVGVVDNIRSKTSIYTPIVEAVVNSIQAIAELGGRSGRISIIIKRDNTLEFEGILSPIRSIEIHDTGMGFNQKNRDSFDTFYSEIKKNIGGKGFGRFMFLKYFDNVNVSSIFKDGTGLKRRTFNFGKQYQIIDKEVISDVVELEVGTGSKLFLNTILKDNLLDKELETIARKLVEKLLIYFINEDFNCPIIELVEMDNSNRIVLNDFITLNKDICLLSTKDFYLKAKSEDVGEKFVAKIFKIYFAGSQKSKICLTAHNREVTDITLQNYIPEFEDDFYDEEPRDGNKMIRKNYIVKTYVLGDYLNNNVSLERETFNFDKEKKDILYAFSEADIERKAAELTGELFSDEVNVRSDRKRDRILSYVNDEAPWHRTYIHELDLSAIPYALTDERIEMELQSIKFTKEQETKREVKDILASDDDTFEQKISAIVSKISEAGKNDLAHYVSTRKAVLVLFEELLKRNSNGDAKLEKEIHNIIFPMTEDSESISYEDHNLWLLDERLVFSQFIASDKKISKKKDALGEPDLVIFDKKKSFRSGDNEFSNPLTIFEFKRPKRENYKQEDDPILQVGQYLEKIRAGKYELPDGLEKIKVNDSTPVYGYIVCDLAEKIQGFAKIHQLTPSADGEGYFGYHSGYKMYVELFSFKKLLRDASLRNRIFFTKLKIS
jgi:hypothetical protein